MEVHILPTANPDGWNRAEEGLCSGQVLYDNVPCILCLVSFVMCLVSCAEEELCSKQVSSGMCISYFVFMSF